jgi:hypothetical protein
MKTDEYARLRNCFEKDIDFPETLAGLMARYNLAARKAAIAARHASRSGACQEIVLAQWWEGVAQTIEICISVMIQGGDETDFPELPDPPQSFYDRD